MMRLTSRFRSLPLASLLVFTALLSSQSVNAQKVTLDTKQSISSEKIDLFLPAMYRGGTEKDFQHMQNENWYALYFQEGTNKWLYEKAQLSINKAFDDCLNDFSVNVIAKLPPTEHRVFLLKGLTQELNSKSKTVVSLPIFEKSLLPGQSFSFTFNGIDYLMEAQGKLTEEGETEYSKIYLSIAGNTHKQLIHEQDRFDNTQTLILFIGDLDGDGKPDFLIDIATDYETAKVALFLSSHAKDGELVGLVSIAGYHFDC